MIGPDAGLFIAFLLLFSFGACVAYMIAAVIKLMIDLIKYWIEDYHDNN